MSNEQTNVKHMEKSEVEIPLQRVIERAKSARDKAKTAYDNAESRLKTLQEEQRNRLKAYQNVMKKADSQAA